MSVWCPRSRRRLLAEEMGAERRGTVQGNLFDAMLANETLDELVRMELVLKMRETAVEGWTVQSALMAMAKFYVGRSWVAAEWRQEARTIEKRAEDAENRLAETEREPARMKRRVDMTTEQWAMCRDEMQSWVEWNGQHRRVCVVSLRSWPVEMSVDRGSSGIAPRLRRAGTASGSPALGAELYASRVSSSPVGGDNVDADIVPMSPPQNF